LNNYGDLATDLFFGGAFKLGSMEDSFCLENGFWAVHVIEYLGPLLKKQFHADFSLPWKEGRGWVAEFSAFSAISALSLFSISQIK